MIIYLSNCGFCGVFLKWRQLFAADLLGAVEELIDLESLDEPRERGKQKLPSINGNIPTKYGLIWYSTSILGS